jgi:hypothetical protein
LLAHHAERGRIRLEHFLFDLAGHEVYLRCC